MNFPQVHGARIRPLPDQELAEAEARLAALDAEDLVAVRPAWIEATVARVAAAAPVARGGRLRRAAAAAVAFLALHGFATAATVTAVSAVAVTAVVLWPEGRNSSETMSYVEALDVLAHPMSPRGDRLTAMTQISSRVRGVVQVLQDLRDSLRDSPELAIAAGEGLNDLAEGRVRLEASAPPRDPKGELLDVLRHEGANPLDRLASLRQCVESAAIGLHALGHVPSPDPDLSLSLAVANRRLRALLSQ